MFYQKCGDVFLSSTLFFFYLLVNIWIFVNLVWPFGIVIHEVSGASCPEPGSLLSKPPEHVLSFHCTNGYFEGSVCMLENCMYPDYGGYDQLTGSRKITCTNTGRRLEWTYSPTEGRPACPGECLHPDIVYAGGRHYIGAHCRDFAEGSSCYLYCFNGNITGGSNITCTNNGGHLEWTLLPNETRPSCPARCSVRAWVDEFYVSCSTVGLGVGTVCDLSCYDGHKPGNKSISMTCNTNGSHMEWTSSTTLDKLACTKARCSMPAWTDEVYFNCSTVDFGLGTVCDFSCKDGDYHGNDIHTMTCNGFGSLAKWYSWTPLDKFACPKGRCSVPAWTDEFYFNCTTVDFGVGTECHLFCRYGDYQRQGHISMWCSMNDNLMEWTSWNTLAELACPKVVNCTLLERPKNGSLACLRDSFGVLCMVICNFGFEVPRKTDGRFLCTFNKGYWQPNKHIPSCSRLLQPNVARMMTDLQYYHDDCYHTTGIKNVFLKALRNSTWRDACLTMTCNVDNVVVVCDRSDLIIDYWKGLWKGDYRRQTNPHIATLSFEIVLGTGSSTPPAAELYQSIMSTKDSIFNTLNSEAQSGKFNMPSGTVIYGFKYPTIKAECPPGMLGKDTGKSLSCVGCGTGYYLPARADKCEPCPVGQYTDLEWATSCTPCPTGKSTLSTGSHQLSDCKVLETCPAGTSSSFGLMPCQDCPAGHYQSLLGSTYCRLCPAGTWTYNERSTSLEQCVAADVRLVKENLTARVAQQWTPLTLSMWLLLKNASRAEVIMNLDNTNSLYIHISSKAVEYLPNSDRSASVALTTNTWNRVVLTVEPLKQTAALYLQTQHVHTFTLAGTHVSPAETSIQSTQGEVVISGLTAEVKAWSLSEITASSVSCAAISSNNVLSWTPPSLSAIKLPSDCEGLL